MYCKDKNEQVQLFIGDFLNKVESISDGLDFLFTNGYCWHFAKLLQSTFNRGTVCMAFPNSHFVWVDDDFTAYDIKGVTECEYDYLIPEEFIGDRLTDFKHIPDVECEDFTAKDINNYLQEYFKSDFYKQYCEKNGDNKHE